MKRLLAKLLLKLFFTPTPPPIVEPPKPRFNYLGEELTQRYE